MKLQILFAALAAPLALPSSAPPAFGQVDKCVAKCGDNTTKKRDASSRDACRVMVCPRACRLAGVTSCKWCGADAQPVPLDATSDLVFRLGPDPFDNNAPTEVIPFTGSIEVIPTGVFEHPDGRVQVDVEIVQMDLVGISPLLGGNVQLAQLAPSPGHVVDQLPGELWPADGFFDLHTEILTPSGPLMGVGPMTLYAPMLDTDPIAIPYFGAADVTWGWSAPPIPYHDQFGAPVGFVIDGDLTATFTDPPPIGNTYCSPAVPNSTGQPARIAATGSVVVADDELVLHAVDMPANQFGYFLCSQTDGFVPNPGGSQGNLCLGGTIARFNQQVQNTGPGGSFDVEIDIMNIPLAPPTTILPGETWRFQCWFRDIELAPTSNFTDGIWIEWQ